jgi:hypothetical protein
MEVSQIHALLQRIEQRTVAPAGATSHPPISTSENLSAVGGSATATAAPVPGTRPYGKEQTPAVGDQVRHSVFGDGVVTAVRPGDLMVKFSSGELTMQKEYLSHKQ